MPLVFFTLPPKKEQEGEGALRRSEMMVGHPMVFCQKSVPRPPFSLTFSARALPRVLMVR